MAKVEGWIAAHPDHPLARSMRVRLMRRYETLFKESMAGFEPEPRRSRNRRRTRPVTHAGHDARTAARRRRTDGAPLAR